MPELQGFKKTSNYPVYTSDNLWDFINGGRYVLSYSFVDLHVEEYTKGKNVIKLEIYKHKDEIQAFGYIPQNGLRHSTSLISVLRATN